MKIWRNIYLLKSYQNFVERYGTLNSIKRGNNFLPKKDHFRRTLDYYFELL